MKKFKLFILLLCLSFFFYGCSGFSEVGKALRNEKTKTIDEFLIQKREPLSQPPDFNKLPNPNTVASSKQKGSEDIKNILKSTEETNINTQKKSSIENSIIDQIRR